MTFLRAAGLTALTISLLTSSSAFAQTRANTVTFSAGGAYEFFSSRRYIKDIGYPFVALGYNFTQEWGIEALLGIFHTDFKDSVPDDRGISGTLFSMNGIYHIPSQTAVEPFLTAGIGVTGLNPNRFDGQNEANFNFGIGALIFANQTVALRVEARDLYTFVGGKNDYLIAAGATFYLDLC